MIVGYIGNFGPEYSTENDVRKAFEHLGHTVIQFQENKLNLSQLRQYNYDLLLVTGTWANCPKLEEWLDIVHECAVRGIPTATLHLDTFWGKSRGGRKWWQENMFHTAYIFTADGDYQEEWKLMGKNHIWLPPAVRHSATHQGKFRDEYACDVAFVGSNGVGYHEDVWEYRRQLVDALRAMCKRNGWSFKNPGGDQPKINRSDDMNDFYASAKVTVGDSLCLKKEDSRYWSDRVPEATGRGGFLIMPEIRALDSTDFYDGHLVQYAWGNMEDLEHQITTYLEDEVARTELAQECQRITTDKHTYVNRAETILKEVFNGSNDKS